MKTCSSALDIRTSGVSHQHLGAAAGRHALCDPARVAPHHRDLVAIASTARREHDPRAAVDVLHACLNARHAVHATVHPRAGRCRALRTRGRGSILAAVHALVLVRGHPVMLREHARPRAHGRDVSGRRHLEGSAALHVARPDRRAGHRGRTRLGRYILRPRGPLGGTGRRRAVPLCCRRLGLARRARGDAERGRGERAEDERADRSACMVKRRARRGATVRRERTRKTCGRGDGDVSGARRSRRRRCRSTTS